MSTDAARRGLTSQMAAIFFVTAAALLFQVAQTRIFSAAFGYHLTYLVISVALLGVGWGATLSAVFDARPRRPSLGHLAVAVAASIVLALLVETHIDPMSNLGLAVGAAYLLGFPPFAFASWIVVRSLRERSAQAGKLYAADLAGASTGSILALVGLPYLGAPGLYGLAATLAAVSAALSLRGWSRVFPVVTCVALTVVLAGWGDVVAPPQAGPEKSAVYAPGIDHLATRWDPSSRVDVVQYQGQPTGYQYLHFVDPAYTGPRPDAHLMSLDLSAATPILDGRGDMSVLRETIIAAPYELVADPSVLVIGPGGGVDIQNALVHGARSVEAVEVNRAVVGLMRGEFADYSGNLYAAARVQVVEDEARSYIRRSSDRYDLIAMTVVDSWAALASGSYALTESYLYTSEAFQDYLGHLSPGGVLAVGRWYRDPPVEMLHTAQLAATALRSEGVGNVSDRMVVLRYLNFGLLMVQPAPFDAASIAKIRTFAKAHNFAIEYDPLAPAGPFLAAALDDRGVPATDDRPFFFATDLGNNSVPTAYAILFVALVPAVLLSYLLLIRPLRRALGSALGTGIGITTTLRSLAVGLGFIGAEIVLLQRLTLYLGQPSFALSLGLAALLIGAAIGSSLSTKLRLDPDQASAMCAVAVPVLLVLLTWVASNTLAWPLVGRGAVAVLASAGLGIPLGAVFPKIVAQAGAADPRLVSWAWAINGAASVIGSILAVALTINVGFTTVGVVAAACYLVPVIAGRVQGPRRAEQSLGERSPVPS
jgi:spermidine synthase